MPNRRNSAVCGHTTKLCHTAVGRRLTDQSNRAIKETMEKREGCTVKELKTEHNEWLWVKLEQYTKEILIPAFGNGARRGALRELCMHGACKHKSRGCTDV